MTFDKQKKPNSKYNNKKKPLLSENNLVVGCLWSSFARKPMRNFVVVVRTIINKVTPLSVFSIFVSHDDDEFEYIYLSVCRSDIITLQKKNKKKNFFVMVS